MVRAALVCGLLAPLAHAEESAPASADQIKPAQPSQHLSKVAEQHFRTGLDFYRAGYYASARIEFQAAYDLSHLPDLLHNLSRAAQLEGKLAEAIAFEARYITEGALWGTEDTVMWRQGWGCGKRFRRITAKRSAEGLSTGGVKLGIAGEDTMSRIPVETVESTPPHCDSSV